MWSYCVHWIYFCTNVSGDDMSTILKPGEALSHGRIMPPRTEESKTINDQIDAFFKNGGHVDQVEPGKSGMKDGAKYKFSI